MLLAFIIFCSPSSSNHHEQEKGHSQESSMFDVNLSAIRFEDLMMIFPIVSDDDQSNSKNQGVGGEEPCCSICLADFKKEDVVSHLPRCKHKHS
ncbi:hypothetical protein Leryth_012667 [Lithospermum erythrorhizon]|nr:hypothetical protein Leryth_012667 [Lithospermum erythrorhizon]